MPGVAGLALAPTAAATAVAPLAPSCRARIRAAAALLPRANATAAVSTTSAASSASAASAASAASSASPASAAPPAAPAAPAAPPAASRGDSTEPRKLAGWRGEDCGLAALAVCRHDSAGWQQRNGGRSWQLPFASASQYFPFAWCLRVESCGVGDVGPAASAASARPRSLPLGH